MLKVWRVSLCLVFMLCLLPRKLQCLQISSRKESRVVCVLEHDDENGNGYKLYTHSFLQGNPVDNYGEKGNRVKDAMLVVRC